MPEHVASIYFAHTGTRFCCDTLYVNKTMVLTFLLMEQSPISKSRHLTLEGRYGGDQRIEAHANVIRIRLDSRECRRRPQERRGPSRASRTLSRRSPRLSTVKDALVFLESFGNALERVEDALESLLDAPESAADAFENIANAL